MDAAKRERHEAFVSHLTGGSTLELAILLLLPTFLYISRVLIEHLYLRKPSLLEKRVADSIYMICAFILPPTLLSNYLLEFFIVVMTTTIFLVWNAIKSELPGPSWQNLTDVWRRTSRAHTLIYSCVCIYAVDFPIFSRRFAKTELAGVSLMDTGVGLIAITTGISNAWFIARKQRLIGRQLIRSVLLLVVLGLVRTIVIKVLGYPEHVSEYGIHWNFFLTLAALRFGGFVVGSLIGPRCSPYGSMIAVFLLSAVITGVHHVVLLSPLALNLSALMTPDFLIPEVRSSSLILANAEGLISLPGYFALYLWGTALGLLIIVHLNPEFSGSPTLKFLSVQEEESWRGDPNKVFLAVSVIAVTFLGVVFFSGETAVSRRFVNWPYIALQVSIIYGLSAICLTFMFWTSDHSESKKLASKDMTPLVTMVADNSMVYFLVSNLVTGLLNLFIDTLTLGELEPIWLSKLCQFSLLVLYSILCPVVANWVHLF